MTNEVKPSCTGCGHLPVCIIFRTIAPATKQLFPEGTTPLFKAEDLARICSSYCSKTIMENFMNATDTPPEAQH